jgi:hypothetical protein
VDASEAERLLAEIFADLQAKGQLELEPDADEEEESEEVTRNWARGMAEFELRHGIKFDEYLLNVARSQSHC